MAELNEDLRTKLLAISYLVGPLSDSDVDSQTRRTKKITAAFRTYDQIITQIKSSAKSK